MSAVLLVNKVLNPTYVKAQLQLGFFGVKAMHVDRIPIESNTATRLLYFSLILNAVEFGKGYEKGFGLN